MSEDTFVQEVHEELRRDRLRDGWRRYGAYVIGAAVLIVLAVAANEGWAWWQGTNAARSSDQFYAALDIENGGDLAGAQKALDDVVAQGSGQYPVLAKFKAAGLLARQGKKDDALAAYDSLATSEGNARLKGLALLLAANLLVDKGDVPGVKSRIQGLLTPDDPLHNSAQETLGLAQYKSGDLNGARDSFEAVIADPLSPDEARGRMQLFISQLVAQGATPPATEATANSAADAAAAAVQAIGAATAGSAGAVAPTPANDNGAAPPASTTGASAPASSTPAATPVPAAANGQGSATPAADDTTPAGVESAQPSTPDAALDMAVPAPATTPEAAPILSTGAGLPTMSTDAAPADATAPANGATTAPATDTTPAPAIAPAADSPTAAAPTAATPPAAAAATTAPATTTVPAAPSTAPVPDATTAPAATPAAGTTSQ